jgi:2-C-methyl-D-erythritol 4-phosphate cytidylyltransferase
VKYRPRKIGKIISGGKSRAESVSRGLAAIADQKEAIVAVHDAARPFVSVGEIEATIRRAMEVGAACLVAPVTDTIKEVGDGLVRQTVDRTKLRRALTPQAFHIEILKSAFRDAELTDAVTDDCFLLEQLGFRIAAVEGSAKNFKITTPEDVILAEAMLAAERK